MQQPKICSKKYTKKRSEKEKRNCIDRYAIALQGLRSSHSQHEFLLHKKSKRANIKQKINCEILKKEQ
jgi:hypothetical protein